MSIEMTVDANETVVFARPAHGRPIAFMVENRTVRIGSAWSRRDERRWVVTLRGNREAEFSRHLTEEAAQRACLRRARKYDTAYAVPRGLAVAS